MTLKLKQGLWLWAGALALMLLAIIPLDGWTRGVGVLIVVGSVALARVRAARQAAQQRELPGSLDEFALPPASYGHPVVLVCGDGLSSLFGFDACEHPAQRLTEQGCYLRVARVQQLPGLVDSVMTLRPQWGGQLSVMLIVNPGEHINAAALAGQVRTFIHQVALTRKRGFSLPLLLVSYQQSPAAKGAWFSWGAGQGQCNILQAGASFSPEDWYRQSAQSAVHTQRLQAGIQLNGAAAWLDEQVLAHFTCREGRQPVGLPLVWACTLVPALPGYVPGNLWRQWQRDKTALLDADVAVQVPGESLPFPDPLLTLLPDRHNLRHGVAPW